MREGPANGAPQAARIAPGEARAADDATARVLHWTTAVLVLQRRAAHAAHWGLYALLIARIVIAAVIAGVAAVHICAALYHHFVRKDRVLMRMITG